MKNCIYLVSHYWLGGMAKLGLLVFLAGNMLVSNWSELQMALKWGIK